MIQLISSLFLDALDGRIRYYENSQITFATWWFEYFFMLNVVTSFKKRFS